MSLTKAQARTRVRQRLRDTVSPYEYSDALLDTYLGPALREIAIAVREIDPDYYLTSVVVLAYTDALDPAPSGSQGYEFYPLPKDCASVRWIERSDGSLHYKLYESSARDQENHRFVTPFYGRATADGSTYYSVPTVGGVETATVFGDRFRVVPAPSEAGIEWRVFYDLEPANPTGEDESLKIPGAYEEALTKSWALRPVEDDGDPMAAPIAQSLQAELGRARIAHQNRTRRTIRPTPAW